MTQEINCSVCYLIGPNLRKITETVENDNSHLQKLETCVSDIEWRGSYMICALCVTDLDMVYNFREKCINSETLRKQQLNKIRVVSLLETEPKPEDLLHISDENPNTIEPETKLKKSNQYNCEHCDRIFNTSTKVVAHSLQEHKCDRKDIKPFQCRLCNNRFSTSSNLVQHLRYHEGSRPHMCTFCGKKFITKNDLAIHERIHLNKKEYKCDKCHKCFNTHKDLRSHKYVVHTDPSLWRHVCDICAKRFPLKSNFDMHMRRHKNERPFGCHLCEKKFVANSVLQKHILSHSDDRAFSCEVCGKEYKDKRVMNLHRKKIHGVGDVKLPVKFKKHLCHLCPKSYYDKSKLTKHMYKHTGEKPFFCKVCQNKFVDGSYVKQHMRKVHDIEEDGEI